MTEMVQIPATEYKFRHSIPFIIISDHIEELAGSFKSHTGFYSEDIHPLSNAPVYAKFDNADDAIMFKLALP